MFTIPVHAIVVAADAWLLKFSIGLTRCLAWRWFLSKMSLRAFIRSTSIAIGEPNRRGVRVMSLLASEPPDQELAGLQRSAEAARLADDLVRPGHGPAAAADRQAWTAAAILPRQRSGPA